MDKVFAELADLEHQLHEVYEFMNINLLKAGTIDMNWELGNVMKNIKHAERFTRKIASDLALLGWER